MKRVILSIPEGLTFDQLLPEQQAAINSVFGQFVNPMPGTRAAAGRQLVDAVTADNFDPAAMAPLGLDWPLVGMWDWAGGEIVPAATFDDAAFLTHLPDVPVLDELGVQTGVEPATLHEPHRWAGWPRAF